MATATITKQKPGLTSHEVEEKRKEFGYNEIPEKRVNPILRLLSFFWGPIPWMIEIAAVLSAMVNHWEDFGIILALLVVNAMVGFWEEFQANNTIRALRANLAVKARVLRDNTWQAINARELVPGDYIRIRIGDIIPADAKLEEGDPVQIDQSALTGESLPAEKKTGDTVYSGSILKQGESNALVTATGMRTYFGRTAELVAKSKNKSHFQRAILKIGDYLIIIALFLVILILAITLFRGDEILTALQFALILTIAAIPVAMPTVLSVTMAIGARILGRERAVVSHLPSIEEVAGMDILCSDKTGTLTKNQLKTGEPFPLAGVEADDMMMFAALASREEDADAIDSAVIAGSAIKPEGYVIKHFMPFDSVKKRTEAMVESPDGKSFRVSKGAPQVITALCENAAGVEQMLSEKIEQFAEKGYRSLGVAYADEKGPWVFQGIIPLFDPPRDDSLETVAQAKKMGVALKMVTGDQVPIAREIARQLHMGTHILKAEALEETAHHKHSQLVDEIEKADGFAQVFPEHKYHIVEVLQRKGHIVGMTGDGVNDAPALKKADVGIAVSGATDAARAAADIVFLNPGLKVIINAIKESRKIFQRMLSYATYRITETIRVLIFMALSIIIFNFYPVTAVMIVLLALLNDGAILSIAYDRVKYSLKPEKWEMPQVLTMATILGITGVFASFGMFYLGESVFHLSRDVIQTLIYLKLSVAGHLTIFVTRTRGPFWSYRPSLILLGAVLLTQLVATLISIFGLFMTPIGLPWALFVWGYALVWFIIADAVKLLTHRILDRTAPSILH
jgi:H+-transporting ATPase